MARRSSNGRLEEALATLIDSQASLASNQATFQANLMAQTAQSDERFARIEGELAEIKAILLRHEQMLQSLPKLSVASSLRLHRLNIPGHVERAQMAQGGVRSQLAEYRTPDRHFR